jgi:putative component of membrane protein insertase Oxa1/YidC/SpoIIIJ protein YidD
MIKGILTDECKVYTCSKFAFFCLKQPNRFGNSTTTIFREGRVSSIHSFFSEGSVKIDINGREKLASTQKKGKGMAIVCDVSLTNVRRN